MSADGEQGGVIQADRDRAERIVSARCADWRWPDLDEDKVSEYWLAVEACAAGLAENRLAHVAPATDTPEVVRLAAEAQEFVEVAQSEGFDAGDALDLIREFAALAKHPTSPEDAA